MKNLLKIKEMLYNIQNMSKNSELKEVIHNALQIVNNQIKDHQK